MRKSARDMISLAKMHVESARPAARARATELIADFEARLSRLNRPYDPNVWGGLDDWIEKALAPVKRALREECVRRGIPDDLVPVLQHTSPMGYFQTEYFYAGLLQTRALAKAEIEKREAKAVARIAELTLAICEDLTDGLDVDRAQERLDALPAVANLMANLTDAAVVAWINGERYSARQRFSRPARKLIAEAVGP